MYVAIRRTGEPSLYSRLRLLSGAGTTAVAVILASAALPAAPASAQGPGAQPGVRITQSVWARARPSTSARRLVRVDNYTPMTLAPNVLPVVSSEVTGAGVKWVRVRLARRPNGSTGWVPARVTRAVTLDWHIRVDTSQRRAKVYRDGHLIRNFRVVVGARHTPTPRGHFYVTERVRLHTSWARGLWALALSAHSNVLQEFDGGDGQVALHARGSLAAPLGSAASHGCVRFANRDIAWLARNVPNGTPVDVVR